MVDLSFQLEPLNLLILLLLLSTFFDVCGSCAAYSSFSGDEASIVEPPYSIRPDSANCELAVSWNPFNVVVFPAAGVCGMSSINGATMRCVDGDWVSEVVTEYYCASFVPR